MLKSLYEFEKCNKTVYDSIHEYCLTEKVNEEQLRASANKKGWNRKPARMHGFLFWKRKRDDTMHKFLGNSFIQIKTQ